LNRPPLRDRSFERILLVKPSAMGDVVHTIPVLAKLRKRYPQARIDWLLNPAIAEWIRHHPALSHVVPFPRQDLARCWRSWSAARGLGKLLWRIRRTRYDLVIDVHGQFRSALFCLVSGAPVRIGFDRPRKTVRFNSPRQLPREAYQHGWTGAREGSWVAYTHHIPVPTLDVHAVDRYLWLGSLLGFDEDPPDFHVPVPEKAKQRITQLLGAGSADDSPLAVLVPGTLWETKHWRVAGFAEVARHLLQTGRKVVLAGSPRDRPRAQEIVALCPGVVDLCGQTSLSELAALIQRATICVTNDSGSMHLTVALGKPVVSIFGPTDPVWIGPYCRPDAVLRANLPCSPCYFRRLRQCPHSHACMGEVTGRQVIDRIETILAATRAA
jgi:heptosyltransferase-1